MDKEAKLIADISNICFEEIQKVGKTQGYNHIHKPFKYFKDGLNFWNFTTTGYVILFNYALYRLITPYGSIRFTGDNMITKSGSEKVFNGLKNRFNLKKVNNSDIFYELQEIDGIKLPNVTDLREGEFNEYLKNKDTIKQLDIEIMKNMKEFDF